MAFPFRLEMLSGSRELHFLVTTTQEYLKPEEIDRAIVSSSLRFNPRSLCDRDDLEGFCMFSIKLNQLVTQLGESGRINDQLTEEEPWGANSIRLVICSSGPLDLTEFRWNDEVTLPMKVKLISCIPFQLPRSVREQSCLYKLRQVCGPQNIQVKIENLGLPREDRRYPRIEQSLQLQWNEVDLAWEADTQMTFLKHNLENFGKSDGNFLSYLDTCELQLNEAGVNRILQQVYSKTGVDCSTSKAILEEGTFSDLEIISDTDKVERPIKCHRSHLAVASPVFADMLKNSWEEAESRTVKLPESPETIRAMLHFIYYGGTERIFGASMDVVVELLQAAHKYSIPTLVEVTAFVLKAKNKLDEEWWSVDGLMALFCFARNVDGELWLILSNLSCKMLEMKGLDERKTSQGYLKLYRIAEKLGPVFEFGVGKKTNDEPERQLEFAKFVSMPNVPMGMPKEEVELMFDFMCSLTLDGLYLEIIAGMAVLAEYCGRSFPNYVGDRVKRYLGYKCYLDEESTVDFLVELFCKATTKEEQIWKDLKLAAVRKLKDSLTSEPSTTEASEKYMEMFRTDFKAAAEFTRMSMEEFVKERKSEN